MNPSLTSKIKQITLTTLLAGATMLTTSCETPQQRLTLNNCETQIHQTQREHRQQTFIPLEREENKDSEYTTIRGLWGRKTTFNDLQNVYAQHQAVQSQTPRHIKETYTQILQRHGGNNTIQGYPSNNETPRYTEQQKGIVDDIRTAGDTLTHQDWLSLYNLDNSNRIANQAQHILQKRIDTIRVERNIDLGLDIPRAYFTSNIPRGYIETNAVNTAGKAFKGNLKQGDQNCLRTTLHYPNQLTNQQIQTAIQYTQD